MFDCKLKSQPQKAHGDCFHIGMKSVNNKCKQEITA